MSDVPPVFVIGDDDALRTNTCTLLESAGLGYVAYDSGTAFLADHQRSRPGCLILDLKDRKITGLDLIERYGSQDLLPMVVLTEPGCIPAEIQGMRLGALDFLEKPVEERALLGKVKAALELDVRRQARHLEAAEARRRLNVLTEREKQLLDLLIGGYSNKQVAGKLNISIKTVENHRAHVMQKMSAGNAAELVRLSMVGLAA